MPEGDSVTAIAIEQARRPLRWWHMLLPLAALFLVPLIGAGATALVVAELHMHGVATPGILTGDLQKDAIFLVIVMVLSYAVMLAIMWWIARRRGPFPLAGYFAPIDARTAWLAFASGLLLVGALELTANFLEWTHLATFHTTKVEEMLQAHSVGQLLLTLAMAAFLGPIAEEIYFRGMFLVWLRQNWSLPVAAAVNAILFALIHGDMIADPGLQGWIETFAIGAVALVNVLWTVRTGSLWAAFIVHCTFNGLEVLIASVPTIWGHG
jgi:membrane protease YdiL (CAAX protease family)